MSIDNYRGEGNMTEKLDDWLAGLDAGEREDAVVTLRFIGEAWIDGEALAVDDGTATFDVPLEDVRTPDEGWSIFSTPLTHYVSDGLRDHENAPEWVQNWRGSFTIKVNSYGV